MTFDLNLIPSWTKEHFLLDLETLSLKPNAAVSEVAVIHLASGSVFSALINPDSYTNLRNFSICQETVDWHDKQKGGPGNYHSYLRTRGQSFITVCRELNAWIQTFSGGKPLQLWVQGTDFDIPIFKNLLGSLDIPFPCRHDQVRDMRTIASLFPEVRYNKGNHSALEDVTKMSLHLQKLTMASPVVHQYFYGPGA